MLRIILFCISYVESKSSRDTTKFVHVSCDNMSELNPFFEDLSKIDQRDLEFDEITLNSDIKDDIKAHSTSEVTLDDVAAKLLRDNFVLTALELHTELVEARKEVPRLRDFFSNPGNFERTRGLSPESACGLRKFDEIMP